MTDPFRCLDQNSACGRAKEYFNSSAWREALLSTVAFGALWMATIDSAHAQCVTTANVATCTGGPFPNGIQSGVDFNVPPVTTLNVNNLNGDIVPPAGFSGIDFTSTGDVTLNSSTGAHQIISTDVPGINVSTSGTGNIDIHTTGRVTTTGTGSLAAIFVVANGADANSGNVAFSNTGDIFATSDNGGAGGIQASALSNTSIAGTVVVTSSGNINSSASQGVVGYSGARGIKATSLSYYSSASDVTVTSTGNVSVASQTGGARALEANSVGYGGDTGNVTITSTGNLTSKSGGSSGAIGIYATTYGTGNAGTVNVTSTGDISATGTTAPGAGILAGSYSTYNGNAGAVTVQSTGNITVIGDARVAQGISATSASSYGSASSASVTSTGNVSVSGSGSFSVSGISVYSAGRYGNADHVSVTSSGNISASSSGTGRATGLLAISTAVEGNSSDVSVASHGNITAASAAGTGVTSGIRARSLAIDGDSGAVSIESAGRVSASSGAGIAVGIFGESTNGSVNVNSVGDVSASGGGAVPGGPPTAGLSAIVDNGSGHVSITSSGKVTATGPNAAGIFGQADTGSISIVNNQGLISGSQSGADVEFVGGSTNTFTNFGTVSTSGGATGTAVLAGTGDETIDNFGTIAGDVRLGSGANTINNEANALFISGTTVDLGSGNVFTNAGVLSPGGKGTIKTTALTGNFVQTGSGTLAIDADMGVATADKLSVSGDASLSGAVSVRLSNPKLATEQFTIVSASDGISGAFQTAVASPALHAEITYPDANDAVLGVSVDFVVDGLTRNQIAIARSLDSILGAGPGGVAPIIDALVNVLGLEGYKDALNQLLPEAYLNTEVSTLYSSLNFSNSLMSCRERDGAFAFVREGQCVWGQVKGRLLDRSDTSDATGFDENAISFSGGGQVTVAPAWYVGLAAGYERSDLDSNDANTKSDRVQGGAVVKYNPGPALLAAAITGGSGWQSTDRFVNFGDLSERPHSDSTMSYLGGQLRAAYLFDQGGWYLKPILDLNATYLNLDGFTETSGGAADLRVFGVDKTVLSASPSLEIGGETKLNNGTLLRPFLRGGVTIFDTSRFDLSQTFVAAPDGTDPFRIVTAGDRILGDVSVGADLIFSENSSLRLYYDGEFGESTRDQSLGAKASVRF